MDEPRLRTETPEKTASPQEAPEGQDEDSLTPGPLASFVQQFSGVELMGCDLLRGVFT